MSGIVEGRSAPLRSELHAEAVICGGGAGGAMAARELARAGLDVLLLEQGRDQIPARFTQREDEMFAELFEARGGLRSSDLAIAVLAGRGLGGSTIHNQNLCKRTPEPILERWARDHGIDRAHPSSMLPYFQEVERDLGVRPITDAQVNRHNELFARGARALGYAGGRLSHNRDSRCIGSGFCELGCTYDGKLNARRVLLPQAVEAGATAYSDCRVDRIAHDGTRVTGVEATWLDAERRPRGRLSVRSNLVVLAGGAIGSAALAARSALPDPHGQVGRGLHLHPGAVVAGRFEEPVQAWTGIPQSEECTEFLDLSEGSERRVWLVPSFAHPVGAATLMPSFGPALSRSMRRYAYLGAVAAMVHDESAGRVSYGKRGVKIDYTLERPDRAQLALGVREGARILFAAGAHECFVAAPEPFLLRHEGDLDRIDETRFTPHRARITAVHPMGSLAMGRDPRKSAVDPAGAYHHLEGLVVADASLFPSSIGAPPQISVYAFAAVVARASVANRKKTRRQTAN